ncbi:uncharacterized protein TNCV_4419621 [Trichonephila clavipes]|nr:uncharacterized protein TNCV_4419621 [Trichonephila clavipes]
MFHVLADLEYPCILGVDFISGSKIILDFDRKSLAIPDSQIDKVVKTIEEGKVEIDLSKISYYGYAALTRLTNGTNLSRRMIRGVLKLAEFNMEFHIVVELKMRRQTFGRGTWLKNRTRKLRSCANDVNDQHDTCDQFLREFAYAIRTAVNETRGKTPAELFLGRKLITPFQKLVMISDGTDFALGEILRDCLRKLDETQRLSMKNGKSIIIDASMMCKLRAPKRNIEEMKKLKKSGVPTNHGDEDTTRRTSLSQEKQRKELQPLQPRSNKIRQQEYQTKR